MILYVLCAFVVAVCSILLVADCQYEDGVIGRLALATLAIAELIVIGEWLNKEPTYPAPTTLAIQLGVAFFMLRHVYRFMRWRFNNHFDWKKT